MRLCSGQWDVEGSDPHNFWITSSKKEPLVLSFPSLFLQADMGMWCCLLQPWAGRELPRREQGRGSSVTKNLHSICSCGNMFFGEAKGWSKIRHPSALSQAGLTAFASLSSCFQNSEVFSKSPDSLFESSGNSMLRAFNTRKHPSRAHTGRAESSEEEICKRAPARHPSPARGTSHRPAIRPADRPDLGVSGPGESGEQAVSAPRPGETDAPRGRGLWGPVIVRRQLPSQWPAQPLPPQIRSRAREGKKNAAPGPLRMQFSI